jgi:hypothetical protein
MTDLAERGSLGVRELQPPFRLGLEDTIFAGQIFVPRQQLLVHHASVVDRSRQGSRTRSSHWRVWPIRVCSTGNQRNGKPRGGDGPTSARAGIGMVRVAYCNATVAVGSGLCMFCIPWPVTGRKTARGGAGREPSGLHGPPVSARALGLDGRGAEPPLFLRKKGRKRLSVALGAKDRHRMDETPLPAPENTHPSRFAVGGPVLCHSIWSLSWRRVPIGRAISSCLSSPVPLLCFRKGVRVCT